MAAMPKQTFSWGAHQPSQASLMEAAKSELQLEVDNISLGLLRLRIWLVSALLRLPPPPLFSSSDLTCIELTGYRAWGPAPPIFRQLLPAAHYIGLGHVVGEICANLRLLLQRERNTTIRISASRTCIARRGGHILQPVYC
jgi:hypothetical protein